MAERIYVTTTHEKFEPLEETAFATEGRAAEPDRIPSGTDRRRADAPR